MGVMTIAVTALYMLMYFPMWGGMFAKAKEGVTEEDYYLAEWTPEERAQVRPDKLSATRPCAKSCCCDLCLAHKLVEIIPLRARCEHFVIPAQC
jgi:hypothetical protein